MDDGNDLPRKSRPPNLLRYTEQYETSSTRQTRSKGGKVTTNTIRPNVVKRVDQGVEIMCVLLAVDQFQRGEWECWIGLKEGVLFDPAPKKRMSTPIRRTWFVVAPPAKSATVEQVARHYGYTEESVRRMDQRARKLLNEIRAAAGLFTDGPTIQVWPAVNSQWNMMDHLFGKG